MNRPGGEQEGKVDEPAPFLLARTRTAGERFVVGPGGDAGHDLRRAVSLGGGRELPADPRYRVVAYGAGRHAVYREFELTAADLGVAGPVRDEHGRVILAIEGLAVGADPFAVEAGDLAATHRHMLSRYAELWRTDEAPRPRRPPPPLPRVPSHPPAPEPVRTRRLASPWAWSVALGLLLAALVVIVLR